MTETRSEPLKVLVCDDQIDVREALRLMLKGAGYRAETAESPAAALRAVDQQRFDAILIDMNYSRDTTSGEEGLQLLHDLLARELQAPVIVMTAWSSVDLAVEAMRRGAADFVQKPWDNARLLSTVDKQTRKAADEARAKVERRNEMELARHVQQRLFPQKTIALGTLDYLGRCLPASEVGGDYYDFFDFGDGRLGCVLADVSGKGIAGAMLMANLQATFRAQSQLAVEDPAALLANVHRLFYESTPTEFFVTLVFGVYDDRTRELRYVNCGHPEPALLRASGAFEQLEATALPLGIFEKWTGSDRRVRLEPGDTLLLFSDGAVEAGIESGREFGHAGVEQALRARHGEPLEHLVEHLFAAVEAVSGDHRADDLTLVALRGR